MAKGCRPDFNHGPGGDSNGGLILASDVHLCPIQIMAPPQAIPILCQMEYASVQVSYLWFPYGATILSEL